VDRETIHPQSTRIHPRSTRTREAIATQHGLSARTTMVDRPTVNRADPKSKWSPYFHWAHLINRSTSTNYVEYRNSAEVSESHRGQNSAEVSESRQAPNHRDSRELVSKLETRNTRRNVVRRSNTLFAGNSNRRQLNS
jgi:hypothetical protein